MQIFVHLILMSQWHNSCSEMMENKSSKLRTVSLSKKMLLSIRLPQPSTRQEFTSPFVNSISFNLLHTIKHMTHKMSNKLNNSFLTCQQISNNYSGCTIIDLLGIIPTSIDSRCNLHKWPKMTEKTTPWYLIEKNNILRPHTTFKDPSAKKRKARMIVREIPIEAAAFSKIFQFCPTNVE